MARKYGNLF